MANNRIVAKFPSAWPFLILFTLELASSIFILYYAVYFNTHWRQLPHDYPTELALATLGIIWGIVTIISVILCRKYRAAETCMALNITVEVILFLVGMVCIFVVAFTDYSFGNAPTDDPRWPILREMDPYKTSLLFGHVIWVILRFFGIFIGAVWFHRRKNMKKRAKLEAAAEEAPVTNSEPA